MRQLPSSFREVALVSSVQHEPKVVNELKTESERYFEGKQTYFKLRQRSGLDLVHADLWLETSLEELLKLERQLKVTVLREMLQDTVLEHEGLRKQAAPISKYAAELIDQPAADWELTDADGKLHKLSDYNGKVVLLNFWQRGGSECIEAVPQIVDVTKHFQNQPVAVLGVFVGKMEDAKTALEKLQINHPTLVDTDRKLKDSYEIPTFPTQFLIDQRGIIRRIYVGNLGPELREELIEQITELLANQSER